MNLKKLTALAMIAACCATGCASSFESETSYLAPGFTRASIRGRTLAVVPAGEAGEAATAARAGELTGVARVMREAGARVRVVEPPAGAAQRGAARSAPKSPHAHRSATAKAAAASRTTASSAAFAVEFGGRPRATDVAEQAAWRDAAARVAPTAGQASYVLHVRFTDAGVYRDYEANGAGGGGPPTRTTGRRVAMRLALLRLPYGRPVWVAGGTGAMWRRARAAAAASAGPAVAAGNIEEDLRAGNGHLYPAPPPADVLAGRLTRQMLSRVPYPPVELEPN